MSPSAELEAWLRQHGLYGDRAALLQKAKVQLEVARARFERIVPYFTVLLRMHSTYWVDHMFAITGSPIGVTDRMVMLIDPGWVVHINDPMMLAAVLWHEVEHPNRGMYRLKALPDQRLANLAGDLAINWRIRDTGHKLPEWVAYPESYGLEKGLTLEEYYKALDKGGKGEDGEEQEGDRGPSRMTEDWQPTGDSFGTGKCGSGAGNSLGDIEEEANERMGCSDAEKELAKEVTKEAISKHVAEHGRGTIPADMIESLDYELSAGVVPWRRELRSILRHASGKLRAGRTDRSWARPSLHSLVRGEPRPGPCRREPEVLIVRDTSGSMGAEQLKSANDEAVGVLKQMGLQEVWFLDADAKAYNPRRVNLRDIPKLDVEGRGGTSFVPAFVAAESLKPRPQLLIYMTDGDGDAPEEPPRGMAVVWCIVPTPYGRRPAEWGHLVIVSDDQKLREPYRR